MKVSSEVCVKDKNANHEDYHYVNAKAYEHQYDLLVSPISKPNGHATVIRDIAIAAGESLAVDMQNKIDGK